MLIDGFIKVMRFVALGLCAVFAVAYLLSLITGGLLFDLVPSEIASWFMSTVIIFFAAILLAVVLAAIVSFLFGPPFPTILTLIGVLLLILGGVVGFLYMIGEPVFDLESLLAPMFDFLNK